MAAWALMMTTGLCASPGLFADQYAGYAACRLRFTTAAVPVTWYHG
jgi:hypothetical protein